MNITIVNKKTSKFTQEAKTELKEQILMVVDKVVEEAERMEAARCQDIKKIQITPYMVEKAMKYVIEERVERHRDHWSIRFICPLIQTLIAIGLTVALTYDLGEYKGHVIIIGVFIYIILWVIDIVYHLNSK